MPCLLKLEESKIVFKSDKEPRYLENSASVSKYRIMIHIFTEYKNKEILMNDFCYQLIVQSLIS